MTNKRMQVIGIILVTFIASLILVTAGGGAPLCHGDLNGDHVVNNFDIDGFAIVYKYPTVYQRIAPLLFMQADMDDNGVINDADADAFLALVLHGSTPCQ